MSQIVMSKFIETRRRFDSAQHDKKNRCRQAAFRPRSTAEAQLALWRRGKFEQRGGSKTMSAGNEMLSGGNKTTPDGNETLYGGSKTTPDGNETLHGGSKTAPDGNKTLYGGSKTASDGNEPLYNGSNPAYTFSLPMCEFKLIMRFRRYLGSTCALAQGESLNNRAKLARANACARNFA